MPESEAEKAAREWLRFADDDLVLARGGLTRRQIFQPRQVCFHAQQAAEKAIKSLLVTEQIEFRFTHDLEQLVQSLPSLTRLDDGRDRTRMARTVGDGDPLSGQPRARLGRSAAEPSRSPKGVLRGRACRPSGSLDAQTQAHRGRPPAGGDQPRIRPREVDPPRPPIDAPPVVGAAPAGRVPRGALRFARRRSVLAPGPLSPPKPIRKSSASGCSR